MNRKWQDHRSLAAHYHRCADPTYARFAFADWAVKWQEALVRAGYKYERCDTRDGALHDHHKTYDRFGYELSEDLEIFLRTVTSRSVSSRT